jgi:protein-S-isoprenylcysteine O-methyltransferase Ste14
MAGAVCIIWCAYLHLSETGESFGFEATPRYLLIRGPYRYSRNPIYVAVFTLWAGWSLFYGSVAVLCGLAVALLIISGVVVPFEERTLQARFGEAYGEYRSAVPRFIPRS